jgi:peptide-methionine (S)-S-oxide reductase
MNRTRDKQRAGFGGDGPRRPPSFCRGVGVVLKALRIPRHYLLMILLLTSCNARHDEEGLKMDAKKPNAETSQAALATFGAGCFWCVEAVFRELDGVVSVESGYAGGNVPNPTYKQVCTGATGHAEVCQIGYDPARITYAELLEVFWKVHDPTTLNRQGNDVGTQYRSVIFYHNDEQKAQAEKYKRELDASGAWKDPIVTEITPFTAFYKAEDYHQDYFRNNPQQAYCRIVIRPKMEKFRAVFTHKLRTGD